MFSIVGVQEHWASLGTCTEDGATAGSQYSGFP